MTEVRHEGSAGSAEPENLAVRGNLLQQLWFDTAALQMEYRVTEPLAGNKLVEHIPRARMAKDCVLIRVHCRRSSRFDVLLLRYPFSRFWKDQALTFCSNQ